MNIVQIVKENKLLGPVYYGLTKGVEIVPYYLYVEGLLDDQPLDLKIDLPNHSVSALNVSDVKMIAAHPEVPETEEELIYRLDNGCICIGLKEGDDLAAYTWCNLLQCKYENRLSFPLKGDEAYLFDARTFIRYRGKAIAPYLRYQLYLKLNNMGRSKFYSTTSAFNTSAKRFKEKLNSKILKLYLYVGLFNKIRFNIPLRKYH